MKLISLELIGYNRMMLSGSRYFKIEPSEIIQLILGTNGSGKSSLLREIFPLAAVSSDFTAEGSKYAVYEHKGSRYELRSSFSPQKHSFIKDGEELNQGGTQRVQNELVRQEFGITSQIRDLLIGVTRFSTMSPLARRELFTQMSEVDYTYGLGLFNRLRERLRDTSGALKLAKNRLTIEAAKVMEKPERERIQDKVNLLHKTLTELLELREPIKIPSAQLEAKMKEKALRLEHLTNELLKLDYSTPKDYKDSITSPEDIQQHITVLREQSRASQELNAKYLKEYEQLEKDVRVLEASGGKGVSEIRENLKELSDYELSLKSQFKRNWSLSQPKEAIVAFETIKDELIDIFSSIESNEDLRFSTPKLNELRDTKKRLTLELEALTKEIDRIARLKSHLEHHKSQGVTTCPKCQYNWTIGFSEKEYEQTLKELNSKEELRLKLTKDLQGISEELESSLEYFSTYRRYLSIKDRFKSLEGFWQLIEKDGLSYKYPRMVLDYVQDFVKDIPIFNKIFEIEEERSKLTTLLQALEQVDLAQSSQTRSRLKEINDLVEKETLLQQVRSVQIDQYRRFYERVKAAQSLSEEILTLTKEAGEIYKQTIDTLNMEHLHGLIRQVQSELATNEDILAQVQVQQNLILDLESQINILQTEEQAAKLLVQELSPTEGLIAEGLMGFINSYTSQMNAIISRIWSYPLEILPCSFSEDSGADLDYRFPMRVKNVPKPIPDIIAGSVGMREITDLAFKVVATKYLGLSDMPLFLDEFGAGFDAAHRNSSMTVIRQLIDQLSFNQVFIVSHYEASYGSLANAQICVLCDENIVVPYEYNEHVTIN